MPTENTTPATETTTATTATTATETTTPTAPATVQFPELVESMTFGVEIETTIPYGRIRVGMHGRGIPIPELRNEWKADRDPSIRTTSGREACEFVSGIFKGSAGLKQCLADLETIKTQFGAAVNASCGL